MALYRSEVGALADRLSVTEQHAASLEASNMRLGVLAAQRHEAVTLMVAARLAQADAEVGRGCGGGWGGAGGRQGIWSAQRREAVT